LETAGVYESIMDGSPDLLRNLALSVICSLFGFAWFGRLVDVERDEHNLYVSGFRWAEVIPRSEILTARKVPWYLGPQVVVIFKNQLAVGCRIRFLVPVGIEKPKRATVIAKQIVEWAGATEN